MEPTVTVNIDLPQNVYDQIILISRREVKTINATIIDTLKSGLAANPSDDMYPDYPLGPSPDWDYNRMKK
jgi:hypothetical protein